MQQQAQERAEKLGHTLSKWAPAPMGLQCVCRACGRHIFVYLDTEETKGRAVQEECPGPNTYRQTSRA